MTHGNPEKEEHAADNQVFRCPEKRHFVVVWLGGWKPPPRLLMAFVGFVFFAGGEVGDEVAGFLFCEEG